MFRIRSAALAACFLCTLFAFVSSASTKQPQPAFPRFQPASLDAVRKKVEAGTIPNLHSILVLQDRKTIAQWYFSGQDENRGRAVGRVAFDAATLHDVRSITKSIVSLLFGIAVDEGLVKSIDEPVLTYFPEYPQSEESRRVRIRHVLTMTTGLKWDERSYPYTDNRNSETAMDLAPNRVRFILSQPFVSTPGERFQYSGGDVALIAEIIARTSGTTLEKYAETRLFKPLGIEKYEWIKDSGARAIAASGLRLRPRDMAKIGQLVLDGGRFGDRQVVSERWIRESTAPRVATAFPCTSYGYFWWLMRSCNGGAYPDWVSAMGNGGQRIAVVPAWKAVVVITAGNYNSIAGDEVAGSALLDVLKSARPN